MLLFKQELKLFFPTTEMRPAFSALLETKRNCVVVESQKTESSFRTGCGTGGSEHSQNANVSPELIKAVHENYGGGFSRPIQTYRNIELLISLSNYKQNRCAIFKASGIACPFSGTDRLFLNVGKQVPTHST